MHGYAILAALILFLVACVHARMYADPVILWK